MRVIGIFVGLVVVSTSIRAELLISEIMYDPIGGSEFEFIELYNSGPGMLDLDGYAFTNGVTYSFTNSVLLDADDYLVITHSPGDFSVRYPAVSNLAPGAYEGKLNNGGETLTLVDGAASQVVSFAYNDGGNWPEAAGGLGSSLILIDEGGDLNAPETWGASYQLHGTPGEPNAALLPDIRSGSGSIIGVGTISAGVSCFGYFSAGLSWGGWAGIRSFFDTSRDRWPTKFSSARSTP